MTERPTIPAGLPPEAYREVPGTEYVPLVPAAARAPEMTLRAVALGVVVGVVFGAANAYLGLRVGLTVSASIPAAVMAIAAFRLLGRSSILETNMVQTVGSAGESLAAAVIFTLPALYVWGLDVPRIQVFTLAALGGLLGVLFMIPLRHFLVSREHGRLPYPEGTACAEVQVAGVTGGDRARRVFGGLGVGAAFKFLGDGRGLRLWNDSPAVGLPGKAALGLDATPELLGVGFIIGPRIAAVMFAGGALAWLVLIPGLALLAGDRTVYPGAGPVSAMSSEEIWSAYIRYVGAGGVAYGGAVTLVRAVPTLLESFRLGLGKLGEAARAVRSPAPRTARDLDLRIVALAALGIAVTLDVVPFVPVDFLSALLMVVFAFFFVTVSARIVGLIGQSPNPISGMTIATLLATGLVFVAAGRADEPGARVAVLAVGAVVCIAASIAGDTSQDLKTGFLLGATPWKQQTGEMIGVLSAATSMGAILALLHGSYGIGSEALPAPQATLMSLVIDGVLRADLPWGLVAFGVVLAAVVEHVFRQPSLPFAVGLYLPVALTSPILVGGLVRRVVERRSGSAGGEREREAGVLYSSGLVAGAALVGVGIAAAIFLGERSAAVGGLVEGWQVGYEWMGDVAGAAAGLVAFGLLTGHLWRAARGSKVGAE